MNIILSLSATILGLTFLAIAFDVLTWMGW